MSRILIVDDEMLVRTNLKLLIPWAGEGDEAGKGHLLCGEASNGEEALALMAARQPDIVLSDMRMPGMDGLALSGRIAREYPGTQFIALSNYDDYEYVRGTLKNGAVDYILKHRLSRQVLAEVLDKAETNLQSHGQTGDMPPPAQTSVLKRQFLVRLLSGFYTDTEEIRHHIRALGLPLGLTQLLPLVMRIDDYAEADLQSRNLTEFAITNITDEVLDDQHNGICCPVSPGQFAILLCFEGKYSQVAMDKTVQNTVSRLAHCMWRFLDLSMSFSVGNLCDGVLKLPASYAAAERNLDDSFYYASGSVVKGAGEVPAVVGSGEELLNYLDSAREGKLVQMVLEGNAEGLHIGLDALFAAIRQNKPPVAVSKMLLTDLLGVLHKVCKSQSIDLAVLYDGGTPARFLNDFSNLDTIRAHFFILFDRLIEMLTARKGGLKSAYVRDALHYIHSHYGQNLSLTQVAEHINISPEYLSRLFKQEVGQGFVEYLTTYRITMAQALLGGKQYAGRQVAELCGFNDYAHFIKTFKKQTGQTPGQYGKMP